VKLSDRLIAIDANLDDLQAGIEAGSRAARTLRSDTSQFRGGVNTALLHAIVRHVEQLQACAREQRIAMLELRDGISRLRSEIRRSAAVVKRPPAEGPDR
jgi:hypothetical protein